MSPGDSDDLTVMIENPTLERSLWIVLRSPETAEDDPNYEAVAFHESKADAEAHFERLVV